ncbi:TnsA endonuclease N-terminal domain-containing protein [Motilimonas sp. 1_MG-2023]|uniref:TnsA endonuclease N-terminal domain-containing protein n=1 Tax=Motilimonas sp. 1_MG-2023 TaxID=3062672 RepID=UPI0034DFEA88
MSITSFEGKKRGYTPDFAVFYSDSYETFYEIKPKHIAETEDFRKKFMFQKEHTLRIGKDLHVLTEDEIQIYPLLDNMKIIHRYACDDTLNPLQRNILTLFKKYGEL